MNSLFSNKPYMPTLIISAIMLFIAIFLPWGTISGGLVGGYTTGAEDWGAMATIAAILGVAIAFLNSRQTRSIGLMCMGVLALVGVIVYMTRLNGLTVGFGIILELIASLVAIYLGYEDYRAISAPPAPPANPPAQQ